MTPVEEAQEYAVELVHEHGAAAIEALHKRVCHYWSGVEQGDLGELDDIYLDLVKVGDLYFSTLESSRVALTMRALRQLGVDAEPDIRGGLARALGGSRTVPKVGLTGTAQLTLDVLRHEWARWSDPAEDDMESDFALVTAIRDAPGGVMTRNQLELLIDHDDRIEPAALSLTYSPLIELVANGVFGVRGAAIDLAAVEALRPHKRGPWSQWGRLDRDRTWVEAKTRCLELHVRIPRDCREVLGVDDWKLVSPAGGELGILRIVDETSIQVDWRFAAPADWQQDEHTAVIEFDRRSTLARLFNATTSDGDVDPRFSDGCVLAGGRWSYVFSVSIAAEIDEPIGVSLGVSGLEDQEVGSSLRILCGGGSLVVVREPHSHRVHGLGSVVGPVADGSFIKLEFRTGQIDISVGEPATDPIDRLLRSVGIFGDADRPWARLGSALGIGQADRREVRRVLAERERFDLAAIAAAPTPHRGSVASRLLTSRQFSVESGRLALTDGGRRWLAEPRAGTGLLGLAWNRESACTTADVGWAARSLVIVRAWGATASLRKIVLERTDEGWIGPVGDGPMMLGALIERLAELDGGIDEQALTDREPMLPLTTLGYAMLMSEADTRLRSLILTPESWTATDESGEEYGQTPLKALGAAG